jgi:hypothetical protein
MQSIFLRVARIHIRVAFAMVLLAGVVALGGCKSNRGPDRPGIGNDRSDWKRLGDASVTDERDKDEIQVGAHEGRFSKLKLGVNRADVRIYKMIVVYDNGSREELTVNDRIRAGHESRAIDLRGGDRQIRRVEFSYKTERGERRDANVVLWGLRD